MKGYSLLALLVIQSLTIMAQSIDCVREANLTGSRSYDTEGTAYLERFDDGSLYLRLGEDFLADQGPDVQIFLSNDSTSVAGGIMIADIGDTDGINHFRGEIMFSLPESLSIETYEFIVFRCVTFSAYWGGGRWSIPSCTDDTMMSGDTTMTESPVCLESVVATTNWESEVTICPDDDIVDVIELKTNVAIEIGENYVFLLTDVNNNLIAVIEQEEYDFEDSSFETQYVFGVYYEGELSYTIGQSISTITSDGCAQLSSGSAFLTINKMSCTPIFDCVPSVTATTNWVAEVNICASDGISDDITFINNQGQMAGDHYAYIITDNERNIIDLVYQESYEFEGRGDEQNLVFGLSYAGDLDYQVGDHIDQITADSCFILSDTDRFLTINKTACEQVPNTRTISGNVSMVSGVGLEGVTIEYGEGLSVLTDADGDYFIEDVSTDTPIKIRPILDSNAANGISAIDLILVTRHILGVEPFEDPLQLLAADVNNSQSISAVDLVGIQRVLLNLSESFTGRKSWQFIDANVALSTTVLQSGVAQNIQLPIGSEDVTLVDFVGFKTGDVNGSARAN